MDPDPPLFVFDGDCGFCRRWARWVERRIPGVATFVDARSIDPRALGLTREDVSAASYWIDERGLAFRGNRSFTRALSRRPGRSRWLARVFDAPPLRWPARLGYAAVARHRHRLPAPR